MNEYEPFKFIMNSRFLLNFNYRSCRLCRNPKLFTMAGFRPILFFVAGRILRLMRMPVSGTVNSPEPLFFMCLVMCLANDSKTVVSQIL
jgi:hypothetical protein